MKPMLKRLIAPLLALLLLLACIPAALAAEVSAEDAKVELSATDAAGKIVPAPAGERDDPVTLRIPVRAKDTVYNLTVAPVLTTDYETFPFVITAIDYTKSGPAQMDPGDLHEFNYTFTIAHDVFKGVKKVEFIAEYSYDSDGDGAPDTEESTRLSVFVNITRGKSTSSGGGSSFTATPKLIIDGYSFSAEKLYAGDPFTLTMTVRNTSETEAVGNIQLNISDETSNILPAGSGSNTIYISRIEKTESYTFTMQLQSAPNAEAKAYNMQIGCSYDGVSSKASYTSTEYVSVPIQQRIRVKIDNPVLYDEPYIGDTAAMYIAVFNMGKSTLYNCMVDVAGRGLSMEETYFGGNIGSGSTLRADFNIVCAESGDISDAAIVITYEDVYGEVYTESLPFALTVQEPYVVEELPSDGAMSYDDEPADLPVSGGAGGTVWYWYALIGAAVIVVTVIVIVSVKRKRRKESETL